jgi:hypothetical protein
MNHPMMVWGGYRVETKCPNCGASKYRHGQHCERCGYIDRGGKNLPAAALVFCTRHQIHFLEGGEEAKLHHGCPIETVDPRTNKRRAGLPPPNDGLNIRR